MKAKPILALLVTLTLAAICAAIALSRRHPPPTRPAAEERTFQVQGHIRALDLANNTIRIAHEEIPGYMPAMTMPLAVKDAALFKGLSAGDSVQFELSVTENDSWISHIERIPEEALVEPATVKGQIPEPDPAQLQAGERCPDFKLVGQNGRPIHLSDFRGKAVVLTFIYTRCPLPNFCPLMTANFAELQKRLSKDFPGRYHLLSVSIDPQFDRPEVLKEYAARNHADERHWTFATGTEEQIDTVAKLVALFHEPENGLISPDLRTALIGPEGRLVHVWKSNVWTPYEVQRRVAETLNGKKDYAVAR